MECRPAHALYFATYELSKDRLGGNLPGHHPVLTGTAGALATVVNDGVMTPADVIKQRLQVTILLLCQLTNWFRKKQPRIQNLGNTGFWHKPVQKAAAVCAGG